VASYSYCYSDTITYGQTNNAAANGLTWGMDSVLPDYGAGGYTLTINGVIYRYTVDKETGDELLVHVRNKNATEEGYVFQETDDWSGLPGSTINKIVPLPDLPAELFGDGEIAVEGAGEVRNPTVLYNYRYDYDTCWTPLNDPTCPGFLMALYKYLKDNGLLGQEPNVDDPYYNEWVQAMLEAETELEDDEKVEKSEDEKDEGLEAKLNTKSVMTELVDAAKQANIMAQLSSTATIEPYYSATIEGGVYEETIKLEDTVLPDNRRALSSLARDEKHRSMVRSQYDRQ
jgi:hypothetical protein